jgi:hypothetical protein
MWLSFPANREETGNYQIFGSIFDAYRSVALLKRLAQQVASRRPAAFPVPITTGN